MRAIRIFTSHQLAEADTRSSGYEDFPNQAFQLTKEREIWVKSPPEIPILPILEDRREYLFWAIKMIEKVLYLSEHIFKAMHIVKPEIHYFCVRFYENPAKDSIDMLHVQSVGCPEDHPVGMRWFGSYWVQHDDDLSESAELYYAIRAKYGPDGNDHSYYDQSAKRRVFLPQPLSRHVIQQLYSTLTENLGIERWNDGYEILTCTKLPEKVGLFSKKDK